MRKKRRHAAQSCLHVIPRADWLPAESNPNKHVSQLVLTSPEGGSGPLCIVGREVQLVWYATERDRAKERHGELVCVLQFTDCRKGREESGDCYHFTALLLEDVSGAYREWLGHQTHRGRPLGPGSDVLETEVRFSVAAQETRDLLSGLHAPATQPFSIHRPKVDELSSPQLDMLFDVMSFLYRTIPAMELMENVQAQALGEVERVADQTAAGMGNPRPAHLATP
jgi:hypothetical protein